MVLFFPYYIMQDVISEISVKSSHYIIGAVGVIAGLTWRDALSASLDRLLPSNDAIVAKIINAVIITVLLIIMIILLPDTKNNLPTETQVVINDKKIQNHKKTIKKQQEVIEELRQDINHINKTSDNKPLFYA